jgi:hypothetical protein
MEVVASNGIAVFFSILSLATKEKMIKISDKDTCMDPGSCRSWDHMKNIANCKVNKQNK